MQIVPLAYRYVLAHLLPGILALYPIGVFIPMINRNIKEVADGTDRWGSCVITLGISALLIGLIVDALRYVSVDLLLTRVFYGKDAPRYQSQMKTKDDIEFYQAVADTSYAFYQFYINSALAIFFTFVLWSIGTVSPLSTSCLVGSLIVVVLLSCAGVRASWGASRRIQARFPMQNKED